MKKYLLMTILAGLSLQAENNPFDLEKNLQKIDQDQDVLLSALKEMSGKQETKGQVEIAKVKENEGVVPEQKSAAVSQVQTVQEASSAKHEADAKAVEMAQQKKEEQAKIVEAKKEKEKLEVEAYEAERVAKKSALKKEELPNDLQEMKDIIEAKVKGKRKALKGDVRVVFERLYKEKDNPNFTLAEAQKIIDGNKEAGMAVMAYMMGKSLAKYNQLSPSDKEAFDKKAMEKIENEMAQGANRKSKKEKMDEYIKKYPNEIREIGFSFLEDILTNGIPQVDMDMQMTVDNSNFPEKLKNSKAEIDLNMKSKEKNEAIAKIDIEQEKRMQKREADRAYIKAIAEVDAEN